MNASARIAAVLVCSASACVVPDPDPGFTPAWEHFDPTDEGWETTREVLLVADCQFHNLYSMPVPDRNSSAKATIQTAIRSPQLDLFSEDVLGWILRNGAPEAEAVLHLGDALDFACEGEWERFERVMEQAEKPWFMAPGNHDISYFGVFHPQKVQHWDAACSSSGRRMTKPLFIRLYMGALLRQADPGIGALAESLGLADLREETSDSLGALLPLEYEWHAPPGTGGFLASVAWRIDEERPWRSYVLQSIDLTRASSEDFNARVLLLDTCQYARRPEMVPNGWMSFPVALNTGLTGELLPDQLRMVRSWLERDATVGYSLATHHPFESLAPRAKSSLGWLWREYRVASLISAHTHIGYYEHHDLGEGVDRLELNIASTTDWPMAWRTYSAFVRKDRQAGYLLSRRHTLVETLSQEEGFFLPGWEVPLGAPDDYRGYKQGRSSSSMFLNYYYAFHVVPYWLPPPNVPVSSSARETEQAVKDTLLLTYDRLLARYPTDPDAEGTEWPADCFSDDDVAERIEAALEQGDSLADKVALLVELDRLEHSRTTRDPDTGASTDAERLRFKISQAAWASRFENAQGRRLSREDELIRVTRRILDEPETP